MAVVLVPAARRRIAAFLFFLISVLVLVIRPAYSSGIALDDFVQHFEPLFYDHEDVRIQHLKLDEQHHRSKRSSNQDQVLRIQFHAHNRLFKIRLRRSASSVFAEDAQLERGSPSSEPIKYDMGRIYEGELEDDDQSSVSAVVSPSGLLDATVSTASETYYVEPASRYFPNDPSDEKSSSSSFPAVIYKASDVLHPEPDSGCSSHHFYLKHFEESKKRSCLKDSDDDECLNRPISNNRSHPAVIKQQQHHIPSDSFQEQLIDRTLYSGWDRRQLRNKKKNKRSSSIDPRKTTCMLYLQADHLFYAKMGSEEACIETMTRHVQRVNSIYKNIDFDGDGLPDDINFMIKRIKVHTEEALNEASYRFPGNYGVEKFLELFSEEDYNAFCLAYMFTYRDFEGGTLGLAWTGDLKNAGGVCEKNGHYRGSLKSLNTGIVTLLNYGKHVPPAVSHVTLAHEIGHNFGSPHDPENNRDCTPGGEDGNYIMFARATSGDKRNNNKFSPCSLKSINGVLSSKARNDHGCFTEPQSAICGNGVVESGEECDCGWEEDCTERCCFPMRSNPASGEKPCTLRPTRSCSPSQGPCCTEDCHLRYDVKCRDDNGCRDAAYCDGTGPKCPLSNNKPNKTVCNEEFVCFMGECTGSICIAYGLQSCQCLQGPGDPPTKACELCCKLPGDDQPCLSSFEWNTSPYDVPDAHAKAGTPCNNYNGYCDVFQRCREVDPSGPLATLRRLLLSDESIASLKKWIEDHWYGVLFIVVGFVTVIVVAARLFGKRVQKIRQSARQQRISRTNGVTSAAAAAATAAAVDESQNQHIVHPVAVRSKIPLKRKVREKEKRAGKKAYSSSKALAILRRPIRTTTTTTTNDPRSRQRRSGVVSTKEKVRSWLERENPTREAVDSDNESHFPEEEVKVNRRHSMDAKLSHQPPPPEVSTNNKKMMRSISEMNRPRQADLRISSSRHYSRSISQPHHPITNNGSDFRGLGRKTESASHLLSKSCDLDVVEQAPPKEEVEEEEEEVIQPAPQPPKLPLPKSATDSDLKKKSGGAGIGIRGKMRFMSTDFLNNLIVAHNKKPEDKKTSCSSEQGRKQKKIGLGPVKVVLKWHGGGLASSNKKSKRSGNSAAAANHLKKKRKVIVYKNTGNPTISPTTTTTPTHKVVQVVEPSSPPSVNITLNPLDIKESISTTTLPESNLKSRRYSMQERSAVPSGLTRRVSEIQHPAAVVGSSRLVMNQKRNRHSWTSGGGGALPDGGQISIDID